MTISFDMRLFYYIFLLLSCSNLLIERGFLNLRSLTNPLPLLQFGSMCCVLLLRCSETYTSLGMLWNRWLLKAHLFLLFLLIGDRACSPQPVRVSGESRNASSWEFTKPHIQRPRNSVASTQVSPLVSEVPLSLGFLPVCLPTVEPRLSDFCWQFLMVCKSCLGGLGVSLILSLREM